EVAFQGLDRADGAKAVAADHDHIRGIRRVLHHPRVQQLRCDGLLITRQIAGRSSDHIESGTLEVSGSERRQLRIEPWRADERDALATQRAESVNDCRACRYHWDTAG